MWLDEESKEELLRLARSKELREEMRALERSAAERGRQMTPDEYLEWVSEFNEFIGHRRPPFRRIVIKRALL
jgi:hypothetical protein